MKSAKQILDREYLELRSKLLDIGASLDRIARADGSVESDERMQLLAAGIEIIASGSADSSERARQIQHLFSRDFDPQWKQKFNLPTRQ
jgi:hypothetical protein